MKLPGLFKIPPHKIFDFKYRYYDPVKEEFEQRIERAKRDAGAGQVLDENGNYVPAIKGQMRGYLKRTYATKERRSANFRLVVIIAILSFIAYWLFYV